MRWLMRLFRRPEAPGDPEIERRLREAERRENEAIRHHREAAVSNALHADDAREAMEALLDRIEERRKGFGGHA